MAEHQNYYVCPKCNGSGEVCHPCHRNEDLCCETCPVCDGEGSTYPTAPIIIYDFCRHFEPGFYLFLVQAFVRDDGESSWTEPADIGLKVTGGPQFNWIYFNGRMFGPIDEGFDDDGSLKYEWDDHWIMQYDYFPLMKLDGYEYTKIYIQATEGDDAEWIQGPDDVVYSLTLDISYYWNSPQDIESFEGDCDIPGSCATLWFCIRYCDNQECGDFWNN
jgi:hypothetical protein